MTKRSWKRTPNIKPGERPENKYKFSSHLKEIGDFIETYPLPFEDRKKLKYAALIWAYRKKYVVKTETVYDGGTCVRITLVSKRRPSRYDANRRKTGR
jgi:hypothetical protein